MLKHFALFLLFTTLCINGASATGTCSATENNCEFGEWCEKQESTEGIAYVCSMCTNKPDSAEYTGRGTNVADCPWKLTCADGTIFDEYSRTCKSCGNLYESSLGASSSYVVKWDSTNKFKFFDTDGTPLLPAGPKCVSKKYTVTISSDGTSDTQTEECKFIDENGSRTCTITYDGCTDGLKAAKPTNNQPVVEGEDPDSCFQISFGKKDDETKYYMFDIDTSNCSNPSGSEKIIIQTETEQCPAGYYCNKCEQKPCPAGATSNAGSSKESACHYTAATVFKDKSGKTFSLPVGDNDIKIEWKWN